LEGILTSSQLFPPSFDANVNFFFFDSTQRSIDAALQKATNNAPPFYGGGYT